MGRRVRIDHRRGWSWLFSMAIAALLSFAATLGFVTIAGAVGPSSGDTVSGAAAAVSPFTAGIPFSSGQGINIVVPANSIFVPTTGLNVVECTTLPGNLPPTDTSFCDGLTINGPPLFPNGDGSVNFRSYTGSTYPVFALPDSISLGETPGGPQCSVTVACVLYIGDNQNDFTAPHVWSQPFYVQPNADDQGENPGDGSAPSVGTLPSSTKSTVLAAPSTATADGTDPSTVTVTLLTSSGVPVPTKSVTLGQGGGSSVIQPSAPGSNVTNASGVATFTVTDATAESVTYSAKDTTDNVSIAPTTAVDFATPTISNAHSSVVATNPQVAIAPATDTITVTLRDQALAPQPLANKVVTLSGTGTSVVTSSTTPNTTNSQGVAIFSVSDPTAEVATFTATDVTDGNTALTQTAKVTFGTLAVAPATSTLTASTPAAVGPIGGSATVTLLTSTNSPVAGKQVSLATTGSAVVGTNPLTTNAQGQATFSITDTNPETVTVTATDVTDSNVTVASPATISFQEPAPSATTSTVTVTSPTAPADGQTEDQVQVTISDQFGHPLSGKSVTLANSAGASAQCPPQASGSAGPGVTDTTGSATFACNDTVAEMVTFSATDTTDNFAVQQTVSVTFTAGTANADVSTITTSNSGQNPSDGTTPAVITVTLNDFFGNRVTGKTIALTALNGNSQITTVNAVTDPNGQAVFDAVDSTQEVVTYAAEDTTDSLDLTAQGVVTFGHPQAPPPSVPFSDVTATPNSVVADGTATATITVTLSDSNGSYVPGKDVTLAASSGNSSISGVSTTTGNTGTATFTVSDTTVENVIYTATDTTDNVVLKGDEIAVSFTTATGIGSGTTTTTTTTSPTGAGSATTVSTGSPLPSASGSGPVLAVTGVPTFLPWLIGLGVFLVTFGSLERRRFRRRMA